MVETKQFINLLGALGIPPEIADDLITYFLHLSDELRHKNLEKSSCGKFVETIVQMLQALDSNRKDYDKSVKNVDDQLRKYETKSINGVPNESRVALLRVARSVYCLRSKRSIIHKNDIDPNQYDLNYIHDSAKWIVTELVRLATGKPMEEAKLLIEGVQRPVYPIIEEIMGRPLVLDTTVNMTEEALLVLFNEYTKENTMAYADEYTAMDRRKPGAIRTVMGRLKKSRLVEGDSQRGFRLTRTGVKAAVAVIERLKTD